MDKVLEFGKKYGAVVASVIVFGAMGAVLLAVGKSSTVNNYVEAAAGTAEEFTGDCQ